MADDSQDEVEVPEVQPEQEPVVETQPGWRRRNWKKLLVLALVLIPAFVIAAWTAMTLNYAYSVGTRAGFAQKLSKRGWLCKTWEGELAMVNLPGAMPEIFRFSVRNDSIARLIERNLGKRMSLIYEQHRGIPTSCFGETQYFITNVRLVDP